jgi:hypothetical protein
MQKCRFITPQYAGMQIYNSFSACRNHCALHGGMGYSLSLRSLDPTVTVTYSLFYFKNVFVDLHLNNKYF